MAFILLFFWHLLLPVSSVATPITIHPNGGESTFIAGNTLEAAIFAIQQGSKNILIPVGLSSDDELIVTDRLDLGQITDAAALFPGKINGKDSIFIDSLNLGELRQIRLNGTMAAPKLLMAIPTLDEELELITRLENALKTTIGLRIELIQPSYYTQKGKKISERLLAALQKLQEKSGAQRVIYIQSYDSEELQKLHDILVARLLEHSYPLIQMVKKQIPRPDDESAFQNPPHPASTENFEWLYYNSGTRLLASYAKGISLPSSFLSQEAADDPKIQKFLKRLQGLPIEIYLQNPPQEQLKITKDMRVSGIYSQLPVTIEWTEEKRTTPDGKNSKLPAFFSNLDLAPRKVPAPEPLPGDDSSGL